MKLTVTIGGTDHIVEINPASHETFPTTVLLNGREVTIDVQGERWLEEFPRSLILDGIPHEAQFTYGDDGFPAQVWVDGKPAPVRVDFPGKGSLAKKKGVGLTQTASGNQIVAPMPGKIVACKVKDGQTVEAGMICVVLEAMKMENELTTPRAGKIKKVLIKEGDAVDLDQVLVTLEE